MWEALGFAGVIVALGSIFWLLNRLLTQAQAGDRRYSGDNGGTGAPGDPGAFG